VHACEAIGNPTSEAACCLREASLSKTYSSGMMIMENTLVVGARCLAGMLGTWSDATIARVNEDGTFNVQTDDDFSRVLPVWYGVTAEELVLNDKDRWPVVFARLRGEASGLGKAEFGRALSELGAVLPELELAALWTRQCRTLFGVSAGDELILDEQMAYQLLRSSGGCAHAFLNCKEINYKQYWNKTRMGGRNPAHIARQITVHDAADALGVSLVDVDDRVNADVLSFERQHDVAIPVVLRKLLTARGFCRVRFDTNSFSGTWTERATQYRQALASAKGAAIQTVHPNNPELFPPSELFEEEIPTGHHSVVLPLIEDKCGTWAAVFQRGADDAAIYFEVDQDNWRLVSQTSAFFFWDLAQTGLCWWQATCLNGGKSSASTDVGLRCL
jgi:hypothetical protein